MRQVRRAFPESDISGVVADLSPTAGAKAFLEQAPDGDILVNNLGTAKLREFVDIADEDWLEMFQINVLSGVRMTRHYLPRMVRQGWGRVVFVSSESRVNIPKEMIDYGMTKTAQLGSRVAWPRRLPAPASPSTPFFPALRGRKFYLTG